MKEPCLDVEALHNFPPPNTDGITAEFCEAQKSFSHKIVVLDDDPTGTQTVHDIPVYTDWSLNTLESAFSDHSRMFFILTNSRSLSAKDTAILHKEIAEHICRVSQKLQIPFLLLSRGDSTLRGHYPLETDILADTLENVGKESVDGEIFCPFFEEGGRFTINNIHYVQDGSNLIPAGQTEFAKDKTFSYVSSDLAEYIEEKSLGKYPREKCIRISLEELREENYGEITNKLLAAKDRQKYIVNAISYNDLKVFAVCWIRALNQGKNFIARCAGSLPKIIGNVTDQPLLTKKHIIPDDSPYGGLIMVGSHVQKTSLQLKELKNAKEPLTFLEFDVNSYFEKGGLHEKACRIREKAEKLMKEQHTVVIYTSRNVLVPEGFSSEELLALSVNISDSFTRIVANLSIRPKFIIAKGGITSSDVATKGLGIKKATVMGQIKKGIPVWKSGEESKFPSMPYIIFPGNVGTSVTLREIVDELNTKET